jgi:hypothetical protein
MSLASRWAVATVVLLVVVVVAGTVAVAAVTVEAVQVPVALFSSLFPLRRCKISKCPMHFI